MLAKLVVVGGDAKAAEIRLKLPTVVGRGREATLTLPHPLVSRRHCEIFEADGQLRVRDLGSLNGTFVGNERISESALPPGELLTVGTVTFRAVYEREGSSLSSVRPNTSKPASTSTAEAQPPAPAEDGKVQPAAGQTVPADSAGDFSDDQLPPPAYPHEPHPEYPPDLNQTATGEDSNVAPSEGSDDEDDLNSFLRHFG